MRFIGSFSVVAALAVASAQPSFAEAVSPAAPDFTEVYRVIKAHLTGVSDEELNGDAVRGLLAALGPRAVLVTNGPEAGAPSSQPLLARTNLLDGNIGFIRIARVGAGLEDQISGACSALRSSNALAGVVVDLRYANGDDFGAAAAAAGLFVSKSEPLLTWGDRARESLAATNHIRVPVAVLVNHETAGAAEALAAALREAGAGVVLGSRTAGQAFITREFPLAGGARLRLATEPVTLADGTAISMSGIKPDIAVAVSPEEERAYFANAFTVIARPGRPASADAASAGSTTSTNLASRPPQMNEAELVREHKEGLDRDLEPDLVKPRAPEPPKPLVNDPVLARALDLIKGLSVVRSSRM